MKLWMQRHGYAGAYSSDPYVERARGLTSEGRQTVAAVAQRMIQMGECPKLIICSPFQRTIDTARIMGTLLGIEVQQHPLLQTQFPISILLDQMLSKSERYFKRVLVCGHRDNIEPFLADNAPKGSGATPAYSMGEVRRVEMDRKTFQCVPQMAITPDNVGRPLRYSLWRTSRSPTSRTRSAYRRSLP